MKKRTIIAVALAATIMLGGSAIWAGTSYADTVQSKGVFKYDSDNNPSNGYDIILNGDQIEQNTKDIVLLKNSYSNGINLVTDAITQTVQVTKSPVQTWINAADIPYLTWLKNDFDGITANVKSMNDATLEGKKLVAKAISDQGVSASENDTLEELATKISQIK